MDRSTPRSPLPAAAESTEAGQDSAATTTTTTHQYHTPARNPRYGHGNESDGEDLDMRVSVRVDDEGVNVVSLDPHLNNRDVMNQSVEPTTPTLMEEESAAHYNTNEHEDVVEGEMLSIASRRFGSSRPGMREFRRSPHAGQLSSNIDMRRTPGASEMHRSVDGSLSSSQGAAGGATLGFGLTLSSPVAQYAGTSKLPGSNAASTTTSSSTPKWHGSAIGSGSSTTLPTGSERNALTGAPEAVGSTEKDAIQKSFLSCWSLANKPTDSLLESGSGGRNSYSPNTLRLTEDLGNLLLEDDDTTTEESSQREPGHVIFGSSTTQHQQQQGPTESWTTPYVVGSNAPSRVPRSSTGRGRRNKGDGFRRNRSGHARNLSSGGGLGQGRGIHLGANQPKPTPVRGTQQTPSFGGTGHFSFAPQRPFGSINYGVPGGGAEPGGAASTPLNFGGAFAPPSKPLFAGNINAPYQQAQATPPSFTPAQFGASAKSSDLPMPPSSTGTPIFEPPAQAFPNPILHSQMPAIAPQDSKYQPNFMPAAAGNPFASLGVSPQFGAQPAQPHNMGYHMPPPQQGYMNMPHHSHPHVQAFGSAHPQQHWPQMQQYDQMGDQGNWHGGGWMGDYMYGQNQHQRLDDPSGTPSPHAWTPEPELVSQDMHNQATSFLTIPHSPQTGASPHQSHHNAAGSRPSSRGKKSGNRGNRKGSGKQGNKTDRNKTEERPPSTSTVGKKTTGAKSKRRNKDSRSSASPMTQSSPVEFNQDSAFEDRTDSKGAELTETPAMRTAFKDFYRKFRAEERVSVHRAEDFAQTSLQDKSLPEKIHWRVLLELADLSKRANKFVEARNLYRKVCQLEPHASQGWLEYSKLEEECGNMKTCAKILRAGLEHCKYSENLLNRAIKHEEKMGNVNRARELLSRLKHVGIEKVWRTVLEGALLEARAGNDMMARRVLKYLMHHVPWYGPLYLEAYRLERDLGRSEEALVVVEKGLATIPRYGPLWFGAFRLCEHIDLIQSTYDLPRAMTMIGRAITSISKELIWKVHLEAAQMLERCAIEHLDANTIPTAQHIFCLCRKRLALTILTCPPNLRWKVWLASGRMEIAARNFEQARRLFLRAHQVVPDKGRAVALLECARLEEYVGDVDLARSILTKSRHVSGSDWKVWLESVLLAIRCGSNDRAIELVKKALKLHSGTGRLWASLIQLMHQHQNEAQQFESLRLAVNAVPKSGEVWCEGARIYLDPFSRVFDLSRARRHLLFATKFTPQYGDGFLETLRLEIVEQWLLPVSKMVWESTRKKLDLKSDRSITWFVYNGARAAHCACTDSPALEIYLQFLKAGSVSLVQNSLKAAFREKILDLSDLQLRCANADPNYGTLWFTCRTGPTDTARKVLSRAIRIMTEEISRHAYVYVAALVRRFAVLAYFDHKQGKVGASQSEDLQASLTESFLSAPSLAEIIEKGDTSYQKTTTSMDLLESTMTSSDFVSGLVEMKKLKAIGTGTLEEKRKTLFGSDALFS